MRLCLTKIKTKRESNEHRLELAHGKHSRGHRVARTIVGGTVRTEPEERAGKLLSVARAAPQVSAQLTVRWAHSLECTLSVEKATLSPHGHHRR